MTFEIWKEQVLKVYLPNFGQKEIAAKLTKKFFDEQKKKAKKEMQDEQVPGEIIGEQINMENIEMGMFKRTPTEQMDYERQMLAYHTVRPLVTTLCTGTNVKPRALRQAFVSILLSHQDPTLWVVIISKYGVRPSVRPSQKQKHVVTLHRAW